MNYSEPSIIKSSVAARMIGVDRCTLIRWTNTDPALAACVIKQTAHSTWFSVQRLRDRGFLTKPEQANGAPLSFTYDIKPVQVAQ